VVGGEMSPETLLNVREVADFLRVNATTIYTWARQGQLPAIKVGRSWRFRQSDLETWLDENRQGSQSSGNAVSTPDR